MPNPGLAMYAIKEILRLKYEAQLSQHQIARRLGLSVGSVCKYLKLAQAQQPRWPLPAELSEAALQERLGLGDDPAHVAAPPLDFAAIHRELQHKGVPRLLLWEEYATMTAGPISYTRFCVLSRAWRQQLKPTLRQTHRAGDKLFLDYCGATVDIVDAETGEVRTAQIFAPSSARPITPMPKRPGHKAYPTGSPRTYAPWSSLAACRACWSMIMWRAT
jgi:transposase